MGRKRMNTVAQYACLLLLCASAISSNYSQVLATVFGGFFCEFGGLA